jgi:hypothetical protein
VIEPITTIGLGAVAGYVGKDAVKKLLGPTADYLGVGLRDLVEKRVHTIGRIFRNAETKLGDKIEAPGAVPPKVLKQILDDGSFANDDLAVEYLGGILASSRTEQGRDDRGARIAKVVDMLSTYQLRTHYLLYSTVRTVFASKGLSMDIFGRAKMQVFLPFTGYVAAMDFSERELQQPTPLLNHTLFGLYRDGLIEKDWLYGPQEFIVNKFAKATDGGIVCQPSALGTELFLWAFGESGRELEYLFSPDFSPIVEGLPMCIEGAGATQF